MTSEHEISEIDQLRRIFMKSFWMNIIILPLAVVTFVVILVVVSIKYVNGVESLKMVAIYLFMVIGTSVWTIKELSPFIKDFMLLRSGDYSRITGTVVAHRKVNHAGDPTTTSYYPTIRDSQREWIEIELKAEDTELNQLYSFLYLPNTKIAVGEMLPK